MHSILPGSASHRTLPLAMSGFTGLDQVTCRVGDERPLRLDQLVQVPQAVAVLLHGEAGHSPVTSSPAARAAAASSS